ncbi:UDP-2,3-diacylglucosamine diphosphatase [Parabacteroides chinchillae]|uniref:UDP-2,3-diacylglucosamine hydrolase n=1 Tax=Parabacteroides chinchillae TaxID=871327 RepID=A0A8G2BY28_9BACT|nr:UDP-2,3-diacylglucosamine diphosphatase [Parabacteroides chinchillae]SEG13055.1 UDP-2,3-diacylglucosamine hydrolase [Parabacteroides chinchillae]
MNSSRKKIYFASDAHLGARFHKDPLAVEKKLVRWLDSIKKDAAAVWLLGDIFDYWYEYKYVVPKGHTRFLGKLAELSDNGIEIHIFIGNHDIWMFDYLPQEIGAVIHREPLTIDLLGKRFFLAHGDEVDYRSKLFRLIRAVFRNKFCQWLYAGIHPRWTFGFALGWSLSSRKSGLKKEALNGNVKAYQGEAGEYLISFAKEYLKVHPDINFFVFGHRHIMLDLMLSKTSRLLITGDWMQYFSYIEWDGESLSLNQFEIE